MSEMQPTRDSPDPEMALPGKNDKGVYANLIQHMVTEKEIVIDFSAILPRIHKATEQKTLGEIRPVQDVVARIVVPPQVFLDFITSVVRANPELYSGNEHERTSANERIASGDASSIAAAGQAEAALIRSSTQNDRAIAAVRSFRTGDIEEQRETLHQLVQGLDRERPEGQKLFSEH